MQIYRTTETEDYLLDLKTLKENYLRVDFDHDDNLIRENIKTAVMFLEKELRMPIYKGTYNLIMTIPKKDNPKHQELFPYFDFRQWKIDEVYEVSVISKAGITTSLAEGEDEDYIYSSTTNKLYFLNKEKLLSDSSDQIIISLSAGWLYSELPEDIYQALSVIVAHYYENRGLDLGFPQEALIPVAKYKRWY